MFNLHFDNAFVRELPGDPEQGPGLRQVEGAAYPLWRRPGGGSRLVGASAETAALVGLDRGGHDAAICAVFAGNSLLDGMQPCETDSSGHQSAFGPASWEMAAR